MTPADTFGLIFSLGFTGSVLGNVLAIYLLLTRPVVIVKLSDADANCDCGEGGQP